MGLKPSATAGWHSRLGACLTLTPSEPACRACAPLPVLCPLPELRAEATLPVLPRLLRSPPAQREEMPSGHQALWTGWGTPWCGHALPELPPPRPGTCPPGAREGPSSTCPPYLRRVSAAPRSPPWEPARPIRPATVRGGTGSCRPRGTLGGRAERAAVRHAWLRALRLASVGHGARRPVASGPITAACRENCSEGVGSLAVAVPRDTSAVPGACVPPGGWHRVTVTSPGTPSCRAPWWDVPVLSPSRR